MVDLEAEHFSLRWNNFHSNLSSGFQALLQEEDLVDVTLAAGGEFVQAHKIVLSVCSPYFKLLFKVNPCKHPIVILKDVCHKDLVDILQFMYQGEVNVRQEDLATFLKTAELLQVKGLTGRDSPTDDSMEEPEHFPVHHRPPPRPTPKPRSARSNVDKGTPKQQQPMHVPSVNKTAPSVLEPPDDSVSRMPPYKRMRSERTSPPSPLTLSEDTTMGAEFAADIAAHPKEEPLDSDTEQVDEKTSVREGLQQDDPLMQLLSADSSHGAPPPLSGPGQSSGLGLSPVTTGAMVSIPSMSQQDSNLSQEGSQGGMLHYVTSRCGNMQLVLDGYLYNFHKRSGANKYWRCTEYRKRQCRGFSKTVLDKMAVTTRPHNHERQPKRIAARQPHLGLGWDLQAYVCPPARVVSHVHIE